MVMARGNAIAMPATKEIAIKPYCHHIPCTSGAEQDADR
jgi:hypothetical protein